MATTMDSRPTATTLDVETLVGMAWSGHVRVPHFQRDFRWGWEDVRRLFDSIIRGYPIGSLLLWVRPAPAQQLRLGALRIDGPATSDALWVVDGQQRLTSLANTLSPAGQADPRFALSFDLKSQTLVRTPAIETASVVPLSVVFDLQSILKWFSDHPEIADYLDVATTITRRIRQFQIPAYQVTVNDQAVLQDIFDRMNNYGKRLSRAEIFSALNAAAEEDHGTVLTFDAIAAGIESDMNFGIIDNDTVLAAVLARRGPDLRREIRVEFDHADDEGRDAAYSAGDEALRRAVQFLQKEVGVPHLTFLAYRYLLVVLSRVFAHHPNPDPRNRQLLRRWYWRAAIVGPENFKGGTPNAGRVLCSKVSPTDLSLSVQELLAAVSNRERVNFPDVRKFSARDASTKIILCHWWSREPRDPYDGHVYDLQELAQSLVEASTARAAVRVLAPPRLIPDNYRGAASRVLMPGVEVDTAELMELLTTPRLDFSEGEWLGMLDSHGITELMSAAMAQGDLNGFFRMRQSHLQGDLERFLRRMTELEFEDTPPLDSLVLLDEGDEDDA